MEVRTHEAHCAEHVDRLRGLVNEAMPTLVAAQQPVELYEPVRYVLAGQGKRLRPILLLLAAEAFGAGPERALPAALAIELFHNFTLVHDDIMDHAEARRGRPTVHVRWDQSTAILCGDYLMALSYDLLARVPSPRLPQILHAYHAMVARLCEGQALDKVFESRASVSVAEYLGMVDRKTAALLQASLELGGLIGRAVDEELAPLREIGRHVGRAFQIQDDLLDLVADDHRWGKVIGGDLMEGKKTFLLLRALEVAGGADQAWFTRIVARRGLPEAEVPEARARMERLGVLEDAREAVLRHSTAAEEQLTRLPPSPAVDTLRWLVRRMQARLH